MTQARGATPRRAIKISGCVCAVFSVVVGKLCVDRKARPQAWERGCCAPATCTHVCPALPAFSVQHSLRPRKDQTPCFSFLMGSQSVHTSPYRTCPRGAVTVLPSPLLLSAISPWAAGGGESGGESRREWQDQRPVLGLPLPRHFLPVAVPESAVSCCSSSLFTKEGH